MADAISEIVKQLEQQGRAIEKALAALREIGVDGTAPAAPISEAAPLKQPRAKRKGGMTPEGKQRLVAALKARWAAKKANAETASTPPATKFAPATKKHSTSAAGRKRLAEAMKKRWAVKRTAAQAKKRGSKKAA